MCIELVERITEYLEGTLPRGTRQRVEKHLAVCEGCQAYLEQMRFTVRATGKLSEASLSEPAKAKLLDAFRSWSGRDVGLRRYTDGQG